MIKEKVIPNAKKLAGFKGGYWLVDRKTGVGLSVTLFESEAALQSSEEAATKLREQATAAGDACESLGGITLKPRQRGGG